MKHFLLAAAALAMSLGVSAAGLGDIKTVYLLPMSNGLDQYLAQQLTAGAVLQVVTDPQKRRCRFHRSSWANPLSKVWRTCTRPSPRPTTKTAGRQRR